MDYNYMVMTNCAPASQMAIDMHIETCVPACMCEGRQLPAGWTQHVDEASGNTYYHNAANNVSQWERPTGVAAVRSSLRPCRP